MTEGNNPVLVGGFVKAFPDSLVDLATDVMADPQVERPLPCDKSHGDTLTNDADIINVIDPDRSAVLHFDSPIFQGVACLVAHLSEALTDGVNLS